MKVKRIGNDVHFEFRHAKQYVRRVVSLEELTDFLEGGRREETNLPAERLPVKFSEFVEQKYLPRCAKPNLKSNSYEREKDSSIALRHFFGDFYLHKIDLEAWETYKTGRLNGTLAFSRRRCANTTVDKELDCLRRSLSYAAQLGLIKRNPLLGVKGLKGQSRREIWLRKHEIERLLGCCDTWLRDLVEFRILTGARPTEALMFGKENVDWKRNEIWLATLKKRRNGIHKRYFSIPSLGQRFETLLKRLIPHPDTRLYFCRKDGTPYPLQTIDNTFVRTRRLASLDGVTPYDLRGTFAMHRAIVVKNFRQLQTEMGHSNPMSIQSYLDEANRYQKDESIFYDPEAEKLAAETDKTAHKSAHFSPDVDFDSNV